MAYIPLNYSGPLGSPLRVLRPVLVRYVEPLKPLIGVFDRRLDRRLVPQNVLGVEACGLGVGRVLALSVPVYIPLLTLFILVQGEVRGASSPEVNGFLVIYHRLIFFVRAPGWRDLDLHT